MHRDSAATVPRTELHCWLRGSNCLKKIVGNSNRSKRWAWSWLQLSSAWQRITKNIKYTSQPTEQNKLQTVRRYTIGTVTDHVRHTRSVRIQISNARCKVIQPENKRSFVSLLCLHLPMNARKLVLVIKQIFSAIGWWSSIFSISIMEKAMANWRPNFLEIFCRLFNHLIVWTNRIFEEIAQFFSSFH